MPRMTRQARHRTVIAQKERQIGKLRDEVERLRKILLERIPEPVKTGKPFYLKPKYRKNYIRKTGIWKHWKTETRRNR